MASYDPDFHGVDPGKETWPADAEPRRRGCLFYGCVGAVVLSVLLMLALALAALVSYRTIVRYRDMYTSDAPVELPKLATSEEERARAVARVEAFRKAVEAGEAVGPLSLSGDDLNALIQESPRLKDHVFLSIVGDHLKARVSIPLTELQDFSLTRGRYLNGEAEVKVALRDGRVKLEVVSMLAEGKELPPMVRDILARSDIVLDDEDDEDDEDDTDEDRRFKGFLRRIASLEVKDGAMVITPRPPSGPAPPEGAARSGPGA
ncbi:MAG: hypothetical protein BGO49_30415 [Planctomycetales bacterium 71-10]|nr:MAG: hypothetical protein BGO49_30415 [Planctomycetales bacterium 71-10]